MLIQSPRVRSSDMVVWFFDEEYDCLLSQVKAKCLHQKAQKSQQVIIDFLKDGDAFISCSWGKDAVLTCFLTWTACQRYGIAMPTIAYSKVDGARKANPDCDLVRDYFLANWPSPYIEQQFNTNDHPGSHRDLHFKMLEDKVGTHRHLTGIRNAESRRRVTRFETQGFSTKNTCAPLSLWTTEDVFCYAYMMKIPLHPAYAMNGSGTWPRNHLRVHSIGGESGCEFSRRSWEAMYYPELINELYPRQARAV